EQAVAARGLGAPFDAQRQAGLHRERQLVEARRLTGFQLQLRLADRRAPASGPDLADIERDLDLGFAEPDRQRASLEPRRKHRTQAARLGLAQHRPDYPAVDATDIEPRPVDGAVI